MSVLPGLAGNEGFPEPNGTLVSARTAPWHALSVDEVAARLVSDPVAGLPSVQAAARLIDVGRNEIEARKRATLVGVLVEGLTEPFILVLAVAGLLAIVLGEVRDGLLILAALVPLHAGDVAPADLRLVAAGGLLVDRSVLTGESVPEPVDPGATVAPEAPLGE